MDAVYDFDNFKNKHIKHIYIALNSQTYERHDVLDITVKQRYSSNGYELKLHRINENTTGYYDIYYSETHLLNKTCSGIEVRITNKDIIRAKSKLSIDVFQTDKKIIIKSTIAGVKPEDLKISLHHDLLTIKGSRSLKEEVSDEDYLYKECYWGAFSRSIILPTEVDNKHVEAELESGVLTISLYKNHPSQIEVKEKD